MSQKIKKLLNAYQDVLAVTVIILLKVIFFSFRLQIASWAVIICSLAVTLMLCSLSLMLPNLGRAFWLLGLNFILSGVLLADSLFFRFFHSVITIPVLFEASQVQGVSSSILALVSTADLLFFLDFLVMIPYFVFLSKTRIKQSSPLLLRVGRVAVVLLVCSSTLLLNTKNAFAYFNDNDFTGITLDQTVLRNLGVVNFHLYDLYSFIKQKDSKGAMANAAPQLKDWMYTHSQQTGNNLTGVAKGKNLIVIQMEAMQGFLVGRTVNGQQVTPNLNSLTQSSIYFDNYFTQVGQGNTSDAEFMTLNSLYPAATGANYVLKDKNNYQSLPTVLAGAGYQGSYVFHANTPEFWNRENMYQAEGFSNFYNNSNFFKDDETVGMGLSDQSMFAQVASQLKQLPQPYLSFIITLSGHYPYDIPADKKGLSIPEGEFSATFTDYLQAQHYADQALGEFINQLKQQGIWDNSVVVVYGDHYGTGWTDQDVAGFTDTPQPLTTYTRDELNKVPLVIHLPGDQAAGVSHLSGGQMDLLPTLFNLLGIDSNNQFFFGQDLLNAKAGFSAFRVWAPDGSFATDKVFYIANWDGNFGDGTAYDRITGQPIGLDGLKGYYDMAEWELHASDLILQANGLPQLIN